MFAWLSGEPFYYRKSDIEKLDRWYIRNILQYPRDKEGNLKITQYFSTTPEYTDEKQKFYRSYKDWDYPDWVIEKQWEPQVVKISKDKEEQAEAFKKLQENLKKQQRRTV
jgi:hypothetical protein